MGDYFSGGLMEQGLFLGENCQLSESNFLGAESWR